MKKYIKLSQEMIEIADNIICDKTLGGPVRHERILKMKPLVLLAIVLLALSGVTFASTAAEPTSIPLKAQETRLELLSDRDGSLHFRLELGQLTAETVSTKGGDFTRLLIPGGHTSKIEGAPLLPMVNELIEIPFGAEPTIEILTSSSRDLDLAGLGFAHPLIPAQPSMSKSADPATVPFVHDLAAYKADKVAASLVAVTRCGRLRGVDIGRLEISPVTYMPGQSTVQVQETIEFRINFQGGDPEAGLELKDRTDSPFFTPLYDQIVTTKGLHESYPDLVRDVVTLVVVTPPGFADQLTDFVAWKTRRGFHTILAVTGTPEVGTTNEQIRDYIHGLYNNATPELPAPSFVIFVGDVEQLPTWEVDGYVTDRPYCAVDDDLVPDIYYGRFSATTADELQAILDKTLMYEQFAMPDPSYLHEVVMIAGVDEDFAPIWGNGQINYGTQYYFNADHDIFSNTYFYPESGYSDASIIQNVSDGVSYINYTAHGSQVGWYSPGFDIRDINNLDNFGKYCLAVGNCCVTSDFGYPECFAEAWLRAPDRGAIGYIGGSSFTDWDEDYWWGVGSGNVTANPSYAATGLGAYDGLFHDHGEAMDQWYVTNDAIVFSGNLAVMEAGSSQMTIYYWNIYNLMGDPSLSTWIGTPGVNAVSHPEEIFLGTTSMAVQAQPGSYCGLSQDGRLLGAGSVDETGTVEIGVWGEMTVGQAELIVMGQNLEPYSAAINVEVPAVITCDPAAIDAGVPTVVTVGIYENDGITPWMGIEVWAEGIGYTSDVSVTGEDGLCQLTIDYPFGPAVYICGQDPVLTWLQFREALPVNALAQEDIALRVSTEIGLTDVFPLNLPGTLEAYSISGGDLPDHELWIFLNDEPGQMSTGDSLVLTPVSPGQVRGVFTQVGYDLVEAIFPVQEVYGTLIGQVGAADTPAAGAVVVGRNQGQEVVFEAVCDLDGNYVVSTEILVAAYQISVNFFGYDPYEQDFFVDFGANLLNIDLAVTPFGGVGGTVRDQSTNLPLAATIKFFREDTGEFFAEVTSEPVTGNYTFGALPYYTYTVTARAAGHVTQSATVQVAEEDQVQDFLLDQTTANVLLINDSIKSEVREPKLGLDGELLITAGEAIRSDASLIADLESLGYTVLVESLGSDPATWRNYDLMITCASNSITTFDDSQFRQNLLEYVQDGGRLLVEGGEVGFVWTQSDPAWAQTVLHASDCLADFGGYIWVHDPAHPVMSFPNPLSIMINIVSYDYSDMDVLAPTPDAQIVGSWTSYLDAASVIAYNADGTPDDGDFVFFTWCYDNADPVLRVQLLDNAMTWLTGNGVTPAPDGLPQPPAKLALRANYPNPFNPQTTISFDLPRSGMVELNVYDVKGRRVVTLINENMPAGRHEAVWRGFDHKGTPVASGVYFLQLNAESKLLTSKMLLLK